MPGGELLELITVLPATSGALPASAGSGARVSAVNVITGRTGQARSRLHFSPGVDGVDVVVGAPVSPGVLAGCGVVCQSTRNCVSGALAATTAQMARSAYLGVEHGHVESLEVADVLEHCCSRKTKFSPRTMNPLRRMSVLAP